MKKTTLEELDTLLAGDEIMREKTETESVTAREMRAFIERYERVEADRKACMEDQKEIMAEAKGRGYDTKILKKIIALRKRSADDIAEEEALLDMYRSALGM